jgi:uncharacterized protein
VCVVNNNTQRTGILASRNPVCLTALVNGRVILVGMACWLSLCACGHRPATNSTEKNTPWIVAAEKGAVTAVVELLGGKEHVNDADKEGYTAVHRAAHCGDVRVVKTLIAAGADVNAKTKQNVTPLLISIAMMCPDSAVTMALIEAGADVKAAEDGGDTAIVIAGTESSLEVLQELLKRRANVDAQGQGGETALHYAAMNNLLDRTEILLKAGVSFDIKNGAGQTPLDVAMPEANG